MCLLKRIYINNCKLKAIKLWFGSDIALTAMTKSVSCYKKCHLPRYVIQ